MLIIGAKGFAKEVLEVLYQNNYSEKIYFFDDVNVDCPNELFGFKVFKSLDQVKSHFKGEFPFTLGIGTPKARKLVCDKFEMIGGVLQSTISPFARIGSFDNQIGVGVNIMTGVVLTNSVHVGKGTLINLNCTIGHDSHVGEFVEISPGSHISGNCIIGDGTQIGTNATILPKIKIGNNVIVGAGTVVIKDVPEGVTVVGVPGRII
jgi:sugar O-acyltransferase (sialic acid O-acetyltransferase NeuD family)